MKRLHRSLSLLVALALTGLLLAGCGSLPREVARVPSQALADTTDTRLGQTVQALTPPGAAAQGHSGVLALVDGVDAFAARLALVRAAERSIDIQTYIWADDNTGRMLVEQLRRAADRGVRVRLLIDDNTTGRLEDLIALLDDHPGIEVRLFNPFPTRPLRVADWLSDFDRMNRRMHNKTFTADNQLAIVGGRNIGNAYFAAGPEVSFEDTDLLVAGTVVPQVSASFDQYWNSALAYTAAAVLPPVPVPDAQDFRQRLQQAMASPQGLAYRQALATSDVVEALASRRLPLAWTRVRVLADEPDKLQRDPQAQGGQLFAALQPVLAGAQTSLDLVSAYFVPGDVGTEALAAVARRGVRVRVLTNSLAATDVTAAHAGYARHRAALLAAGVRLFELKPAFSPEAPRRRARVGSSQASLHAKTFAIDGRQVFVGSFNLDPRSVRLNTEIGLLVDSPALAAEMGGVLEQMTPDFAWEVTLDPAGHLHWSDGASAPLHREPDASLWRRVLVRVLSWLPIDGLL